MEFLTITSTCLCTWTLQTLNHCQVDGIGLLIFGSFSWINPTKSSTNHQVMTLYFFHASLILVTYLFWFNNFYAFSREREPVGSKKEIMLKKWSHRDLEPMNNIQTNPNYDLCRNIKLHRGTSYPHFLVHNLKWFQSTMRWFAGIYNLWWWAYYIGQR